MGKVTHINNQIKSLQLILIRREKNINILKNRHDKEWEKGYEKNHKQIKKLGNAVRKSTKKIKEIKTRIANLKWHKYNYKKVVFKNRFIENIGIEAYNEHEKLKLEIVNNSRKSIKKRGLK